MKKEEILKIIHNLWLKSSDDKMRNEMANAYCAIEKYMEDDQ